MRQERRGRLALGEACGDRRNVRRTEWAQPSCRGESASVVVTPHHGVVVAGTIRSRVVVLFPPWVTPPRGVSAARMVAAAGAVVAHGTRADENRRDGGPV